MSYLLRRRIGLTTLATAAIIAALTGCGSTTSDTAGPASPPASSAPSAGSTTGPEQPGDSATDSTGSDQTTSGQTSSDQTSSSPTGTGTRTPDASGSSPSTSPHRPSSPNTTAPEATGPGATARPDTKGPHAAGAPLCTAQMLNGAVVELPGGGTAGSVYTGLRVTNTTDRSCILRGLPGVSYVGHGNGTQIGAPAGWDRSKASPRIDLGPSESAQALLQQRNAGAYGPRCHRIQADGLRVYPPASTGALYIPYSHSACANGSIVLMTVSAFQPVD